MSRRSTLPEPWAALARALGGVGHLAEACGVTTRTVRRWAAGEMAPGSLQRRDVRDRLQRRGLASPWARPERRGRAGEEEMKTREQAIAFLRSLKAGNEGATIYQDIVDHVLAEVDSLREAHETTKIAARALLKATEDDPNLCPEWEQLSDLVFG